MRTIECPKCGATIDTADNEYAFCPFCGNKFDLYDKRVKIHNVNEDIAAIKEADNHRLEEQNRHKEAIARQKSAFWENNIYQLIGIGILLIWIIAGIISIITGSIRVHKAIDAGYISAGSYSDYIGMDYNAAKSTLRMKGFTNINLVDLNDSSILKRGHKKNTVASITIGDNSSFDSSYYFSPDATIIIQYH